MQHRCPLCDVEFDCQRPATGFPVACPGCLTPFAADVFFRDVDDESNASNPSESAPRTPESVETAAPPNDPPHDLVAGQEFAEYRVLETLGEGRFGKVYLVLCERTKRNYALKLLDSSHLEEDRSSLLLNELRSARDLNEIPNIAHFVLADFHRGQAYTLAYFIEGHTLATWLALNRPDIPTAIELVTKIARAFERAHEMKWVHGSIKPANVIVRSDGEPFVTDFAMTLLESDIPESVTRRADVTGTLPYLSPEHLQGATQPHDVRTDIYGLGALLYEAITGNPPYASDSPTLYQQISLGDVEVPKSFNAGITERLQNTCLRAMHPSMEERYPSVDEFIEDLEASRHEIVAIANYKPRRKWIRQLVAVSGFVVALVLFSIGMMLAYSNSANDRKPSEESPKFSKQLPA